MDDPHVKHTLKYLVQKQPLQCGTYRMFYSQQQVRLKLATAHTANKILQNQPGTISLYNLQRSLNWWQAPTKQVWRGAVIRTSLLLVIVVVVVTDQWDILIWMYQLDRHSRARLWLPYCSGSRDDCWDWQCRCIRRCSSSRRWLRRGVGRECGPHGTNRPRAWPWNPRLEVRSNWCRCLHVRLDFTEEENKQVAWPQV